MSSFLFLFAVLSGTGLLALGHVKKTKGSQLSGLREESAGSDGAVLTRDVTSATSDDMKRFISHTIQGHYMDKTDRFFIFPGDDGKARLVDSMELINHTHVDKCSNNYCSNKYWLYTRSNPKTKEVLKYGDKKSVRRSNFNPRKITVFISHGWLGDGNLEMNLLLTKVFLKKKDVNVIVLDWSKLAKTNYVTARIAVPRVGKMLGNFIKWLRFSGMSLNRVHLVGHSLGGHVVGNAGKALRGKVKRITALDPAGPLWYMDDQHRVSPADGRYVEVIHTNAFLAGYGFPSGHSDHYPNGGIFMTGCRFWDYSCHHARAWKYFAASIEFNSFNAKKCTPDWKTWQFVDHCDGPVGTMGNSNICKRQNGHYRVNTTKDYPYTF